MAFMDVRDAAALVVAGITLAGCGGGKSASDHSGCLLVQTRYSEMVNVMDRWQYGNATDTAMLDALQDLQSGAEYQQDAAKTEEFKAASAKAAETMRSSCPAEFPATMSARMSLMAQRAEAMLAAIKTVRPAFDAFYATLTDEQKKQLESNRDERRFWRPRDRW